MFAWIRYIFSFSKSERNAIILLVFINVFVIVSYNIYIYIFDKNEEVVLSESSLLLLKDLENIVQEKKTTKNKFYKDFKPVNTNYPQEEEIAETSSPKTNYFKFNPNTASREQWLQLGLSEKQVSVINSYLNSGGKFFKSEDLKKIYSISESKYSELLPYIEIQNEEFTNNQREYKSSFKNENEIKNNNTSGSVYNISKASIYELMKIDGMTEELARAIYNLKFSLGGYTDLHQIKLADGMTEETFKKIVPFLELPNPIVFKKIKINSAEYFDFLKHPLIDKNLANSLVMIRMQHGEYKTIEDIKKSALVSEELYNKLAPYLSVD